MRRERWIEQKRRKRQKMHNKTLIQCDKLSLASAETNRLKRSKKKQRKETEEKQKRKQNIKT